MHSVDRAILLVAGRGLRLGSLTEQRPKCLLQVNGMSILERTLEVLSRIGVSDAVLVVGHMHDHIWQVAGDSYAGLHIRYVLNKRYARTNTAYSLWLARTYLNANCLLLEGDILLDERTLRRVLSCSKGSSVWAAVPVAPGNDEGILLQRSEAGYVDGVELVRQPEQRPSHLDFKCAGIQLLSASMAYALASRLDQTVSRGQTARYADLVLAEVLGSEPMVLCSIEGLPWGEVDSLEDLKRVRQRFTSSSGMDLADPPNTHEEASGLEQPS